MNSLRNFIQLNHLAHIRFLLSTWCNRTNKCIALKNERATCSLGSPYSSRNGVSYGTGHGQARLVLLRQHNGYGTPDLERDVWLSEGPPASADPNNPDSSFQVFELPLVFLREAVEEAERFLPMPGWLKETHSGMLWVSIPERRLFKSEDGGKVISSILSMDEWALFYRAELDRQGKREFYPCRRDLAWIGNRLADQLDAAHGPGSGDAYRCCEEEEVDDEKLVID